MQYFFKIFFLIFLFVSKTIFAKEISDFKIENISIGESLLKYTSKKNVYNQYDYSVQDYNYLREPNKYLEIYINNKKFKEFDKVSVFIKNSSSRYLSEKNDNYNILGIRGMIKSLDYQNCLKKKMKLTDNRIYFQI